MSNDRTGRRGEDLAVRFLFAAGMEILHRNWRYRHCEVDIIARDGNVLVFVEVKTRSSPIHGLPEAFVDNRQKRCLMDAADEFLVRFSEPKELRFDIIAINLCLDSDDYELEHFEDAFYW